MVDFHGGLRDLSLGGFWREFAKLCIGRLRLELHFVHSLGSAFLRHRCEGAMLLKTGRNWMGVDFTVPITIRIQRLS